jgi:hypothetical protein
MPANINVRLDTRALEQLLARAPQDVEDALDAVAFEGERIVKMSFGTGPAGRTYNIRGVSHTASAPGSPPNIDTGKLMNAIHIKRLGRLRRGISTGDTEYAAGLEYGTTKMAARPFMRPMIERLQRDVARIFDRHIRW